MEVTAERQIRPGTMSHVISMASPGASLLRRARRQRLEPGLFADRLPEERDRRYYKAALLCGQGINDAVKRRRTLDLVKTSCAASPAA